MTTIQKKLRTFAARRSMKTESLEAFELNKAANVIDVLVAERDQLRDALFNIAHTFGEDSYGNTRALPAADYQDIARKALAAVQSNTEGES